MFDLIFVILAAIMYICAPNDYDFTFCLFSFVLFSVQAIPVLKKDISKMGLLSFNPLFIFSFFFVTYAFPLFFLSASTYVKEDVDLFIDFRLVSKCTSLCTLAVSIYFCAYNRHCGHSISLKRFIKNENFSLIKWIYWIIFAGLLYETVKYMIFVGGIAVESGVWYSFYIAAFPLYLVWSCRKYNVRDLRSFIKRNPFVLFLWSSLVLIYFVIGDRGLIIITGVSILYIYSFFVKRIRVLTFILLLFVGSVLMYIVRETRTSDSSLQSGNTTGFYKEAEGTIEGVNNVLYVFMDLINIHRELYLGYEYYLKRGLVQPEQAMLIPLYPIPMAPGLASQYMFNKTMDELKPGNVLNGYMAYSGHGHFGIHCVIDPMMRYGIIGVVLVFYFFGYFVALITASRKRGTIEMVLYILLLSYAIYIPRAPILDMIRVFSFLLILAWICSRFSNKNKGNLVSFK